MGKIIKVIPQKSFKTTDDFQSFVEKEREWMYNRIVEAISESFSQGFTEAYIFEASIQETMSVITMRSEIGEWIRSLSLAMQWNENQERYEVCIKIRNLIQDIRTSLE